MANIGAFITVFALNNIVYKPSFTIAMIFVGIYFIKKVFLKKEIDLPKIDKRIMLAMKIFSGCIMLSCILHGSQKEMVVGAQYIYWMLPFFMFAYLGNECNINKGVSIGLLCSVFFICGYGIYQYFNLHFGRINSFYSSPNYFGTILAMLIPFLFSYIKKEKNNIIKFFFIFASFMGLVSLFLTESRGALCGLIVGVICYGILDFLYVRRINKKTLYVMSAVLCIVFIISITALGNFKRSYDNERIYIFQSSINMWKDNKLIGVGVGNFGVNYQNRYILPQAHEKNIDKSHNIITAFLAETGIIGTVGFISMNLLLLFYVISRMKKAPNNYLFSAMFVSFIALNIHGMVDSTFNYQAINRLFWGLLGISYISDNKY